MQMGESQKNNIKLINENINNWMECAYLGDFG